MKKFLFSLIITTPLISAETPTAQTLSMLHEVRTLVTSLRGLGMNDPSILQALLSDGYHEQALSIAVPTPAELRKLSEEDRAATMGHGPLYSDAFKAACTEYHMDGDKWPLERHEWMFAEGLLRHYVGEIPDRPIIGELLEGLKTHPTLLRIGGLFQQGKVQAEKLENLVRRNHSDKNYQELVLLDQKLEIRQRIVFSWVKWHVESLQTFVKSYGHLGDAFLREHFHLGQPGFVEELRTQWE